MEHFAQCMNIVNLVICALFVLCYFYQALYTVYALFHKEKPRGEGGKNRLAVLVCARNEEGVIGALIDSLKKQDYDKSLTSVFVVADNCTDNTAAVAERAGATRVYIRDDKTHIGKGYALEFLLWQMDAEFGEDAFDAFVVFDADNLASPTFLTEMNRVYSDGYEIVAGYRNAKNFGDSIASAGSAMWFIREARFLNTARIGFGGSAWLAGTGFLFSNKIKKENGGWPFHTLTEDVEFMVDSALRGYRVGYAADAEFFDEQPVRFSDSFFQRLRWAKGGLQVFSKYWKRMLLRSLGLDFAILDYTVSIAPAYLMTVLVVLFNAVGITVCAVGGTLSMVLPVLLGMLLGVIFLIVLAAAVTVACEWKKIRASTGQKLLSVLAFVPFMISYVPIALIALLFPVRWRETKHTASRSIEDLMHK